MDIFGDHPSGSTLIDGDRIVRCLGGKVVLVNG